MKYNDFKIGFKGTFTRAVTYEENVKFGEISGDLNPLHFEDCVAIKLGYHGAVSNGFVAESRIAAALVETFGSPSTIVIALEKNTKFLKPVYMGDIIRAEVEVTSQIKAMSALKIKAKCYNQKGDQVISTNMTIKIMEI
jgi:3-hydroxybutyryl-CoA dehydratase